MIKLLLNIHMYVHIIYARTYTRGERASVSKRLTRHALSPGALAAIAARKGKREREDMREDVRERNRDMARGGRQQPP